MNWRLVLVAVGMLLAGCGRRDEGHERMVALLASMGEEASRANPYFGSSRLQQLQGELAQAGEQAGWRLRLDTATELLHHGREREAILLLQQTHDALLAGTLAGDMAAKVGVMFHLGTAWLRLGETENCCADPTTETCILPIRGTGRHTHKEGAEAAQRYFLEVLVNTPADDYWHHAARWLFNLSHMTLGSWPEGVPPEHRLPEKAFTDDSGWPRFSSVSAAVGLDTNGTAGGVAVEDFDGDELLDVMVSDWNPMTDVQLLHHERDGSFVDITERAGLRGIRGGLNLLGADYDSDGACDVLVLRGAWCYEEGRWPCSLLHNRGDGTFVDVTIEAGLAERREPTQAAAFADYDLDGDLDLFIGAENSERAPGHGHLYQNDGHGHFRDVAELAGVSDDGYCKGAVFGDIDGDRYPDLFVSNFGGANRLYHNEGNGTFRDIALQAGVTQPRNSFPTWFWDFDNDGNLDLFVADYEVGVGHISSFFSGGSLRFGHASMFKGDGTGGFRDISRQIGLSIPIMPMGCNFGDLDNDGWLDCYLGTGDPDYCSLMPNLMLHNDRGRALRNVTMSGGFGHLQKGHGVAFADFDHDGDQDVFAVMGGAYPGDAFRNALFENPGMGGHWLTMRLVGKDSVRCAIGARICVVVHTSSGLRRIYRDVSTGGSFGSNPLRQTIGLGDADAILRVEIAWPRKSALQVLTDVPMDSAVRVEEGQSKFTKLALAHVPFRKR